MTNEFKTTSAFYLNNEAIKGGHDLIINQGGTRSGKTYSILQLLFLKAYYSKKSLIISVVSRALPHLKLGAMRDFDNILLSFGIIPDNVKDKTNNFYRIGNSKIEFFGADQADKVHGPQRDILFINEANYLKYDIYTQLEVRTSGLIILDYNPSQRFWVHEEIIPNQKHAFIQTTYKHNECLSIKQIQRIEAKKNNENWWRVYGRGEIGTLEGAVYKNWKYGVFDDNLSFGYGLDYGFFPDPDAGLKVAIDKKRKIIYLHELIYETNNGTEDLINQLKTSGVKKDSKLVTESANPRTNTDISKKGYNVVPVRKTKTVADWIRVIQDYDIVITESSYNLEKELLNYVWNDKKAGIPVDEWNHLMDAFRYYFMMMSVNRGVIV